jgi:prepilin-type processing-associated H-X9-DG protein
LDSKVRLEDIIDGSTNTLIVGERPPSADLRLGWWYAGWGQNKTGSMDTTLGVRELNVNTSYHKNTCSQGPYDFARGQIDNQCDAFHFWSPHKGGAHFLFADGAVRFLSYDVNRIMPALATRSGGEAIDASMLE